MVDPRSLAGAELRWLRTGYLPAAFALRWGDTDIGTLAWENVFSSHAVATIDGAEWHIRRHGIGGLLVEDAASAAPVAAMRFHLFGSGELAFADGRMLAFRRTALLPPAWTFFDANGSELIGVRGRIAELFRGGDCRIEPTGAELPEAVLVALLGIYTLVRRARRRARR